MDEGRMRESFSCRGKGIALPETQSDHKLFHRLPARNHSQFYVFQVRIIRFPLTKHDLGRESFVGEIWKWKTYPKSPAMDQALQSAVASGIAVFVAAGNDNVDV